MQSTKTKQSRSRFNRNQRPNKQIAKKIYLTYQKKKKKKIFLNKPKKRAKP